MRQPSSNHGRRDIAGRTSRNLDQTSRVPAGDSPAGVSPGAGRSTGSNARATELAFRESFCNSLIAARRRRDLSLDQIADVTRIPIRSLERLESGEFERLPADVFVRGFLRSYARCVGLDEGEIIRSYAECGMTPAPVASPMADELAGSLATLDERAVSTVRTRPQAARPRTERPGTERPGTERPGIETQHAPENRAVNHAALPLGSRPKVLVAQTGDTPAAERSRDRKADTVGDREADAAVSGDRAPVVAAALGSGPLESTEQAAAESAGQTIDETRAQVARKKAPSRGGRNGKRKKRRKKRRARTRAETAAVAVDTRSVGDEAVCDEAVGDEAVCGEAVCGEAVCGEAVCGEAVGGAPAASVASVGAVATESRDGAAPEPVRAAELSAEDSNTDGGQAPWLGSTTAEPGEPAASSVASAESALSLPASSSSAAGAVSPDLPEADRPETSVAVEESALDAASGAQDVEADASDLREPGSDLTRPSLTRPSLTIDDDCPEVAAMLQETRDAESREREEQSWRNFLPPSLLDTETGSRRSALTLAVIILVIVATLTMSYLLRRPSYSGDGVTMAPPGSMPSFAMSSDSLERQVVTASDSRS